MGKILMSNDFDVVVIGGGAAGLAGAIKATDIGLRTVIIENNQRLGGIPFQCAHPGFGNFYYHENLTGAEYSERLISSIIDRKIPFFTSAHVTRIKHLGPLQNIVKIISKDGIKEIKTSTIIYATGARERHLYETGIKGDRTSGVYTAGEAQTLMDIHGIMPGKNIVIIGSGDIGLIMARRFALEGARVVCCIELFSYPGGLSRNVVQCLHDFDIPLYTSRMVTEIKGKKRVENIITVDVDEELNIIQGSEQEISCDTVALATGLIPYTKKLEDIQVSIDPRTKGPMVNDVLETSIPGVFAAGNVIAINDYVDYASDQGELAAIGAHHFIKEKGKLKDDNIPVKIKGNIRLIVPQRISTKRDVTFYLRVSRPRPRATIHIQELGKTIKKQGVTPSEMIKISVKKEELLKLKDKLTVEIT
jgi:pyruvate/2-oxoglutarate dehydrogenase complex dihydrolipoamide dehydrogenase (E3) component